MALLNHVQRVSDTGHEVLVSRCLLDVWDNCEPDGKNSMVPIQFLLSCY